MSTEPEIPKKKRGRPFASKQIDKTRLLEIAIQEFANKGFEGARQRDIAKQAGITNSLMNYHFDSKEDLWQQSIIQLEKKLKQRYKEMHGYFKDLEGIAAMKAYTRQFIYFSADHPAFYKVVFHEMCTESERADWLVDNILSPLHLMFGGNTMDTTINPTTNKEEFKGDPVANLSSIIIGAANAFFLNAFQMKKMYNTNPFEKEEIEKHADIVIEILFAKFKD